VPPTLETLEERNVPSTVAGNYADGVWRWDATDGWGKLSAAQASILDVSDGGDVYGKFADGLWRWSDATFTWQKISSLNVTSFQLNSNGVLYGDFGASGVWRWSTNLGWQLISSEDVQSFSVSDADAFFGRFDAAGPQGTWRWTPAQGWLKLSANRPDEILSDDAGNLVGRFSTFIAVGQVGTWRWNPIAGWSRLSTANADDIDVSDNGTVFEDRGATGIWRLTPAVGPPSFTQIGLAAANNSTIFALPNGDLYYDYNSSGGVYSGWVWKATTGWGKIVDNTASAYPVVVGKDGDVFFDAGTSGTWYWSPTKVYSLLGDKNPTLLSSQS